MRALKFVPLLALGLSLFVGAGAIQAKEKVSARFFELAGEGTFCFGVILMVTPALRRGLLGVRRLGPGVIIRTRGTMAPLHRVRLYSAKPTTRILIAAVIGAAIDRGGSSLIGQYSSRFLTRAFLYAVPPLGLMAATFAANIAAIFWQRPPELHERKVALWKDFLERGEIPHPFSAAKDAIDWVARLIVWWKSWGS